MSALHTEDFRSFSKTGFALLEALPDEAPAAERMLLVLVAMFEGRFIGRRARPAVRTLARLAGISLRTAQKHLDKLVERELLFIIPDLERGGTHTYVTCLPRKPSLERVGLRVAKSAVPPARPAPDQRSKTDQVSSTGSPSKGRAAAPVECEDGISEEVGAFLGGLGVELPAEFVQPVQGPPTERPRVPAPPAPPKPKERPPLAGPSLRGAKPPAIDLELRAALYKLPRGEEAAAMMTRRNLKPHECEWLVRRLLTYDQQLRARGEALQDALCLASRIISTDLRVKAVRAAERTPAEEHDGAFDDGLEREIELRRRGYRGPRAGEGGVPATPPRERRRLAHEMDDEEREAYLERQRRAASARPPTEGPFKGAGFDLLSKLNEKHGEPPLPRKANA